MLKSCDQKWFNDLEDPENKKVYVIFITSHETIEQLHEAFRKNGFKNSFDLNFNENLKNLDEIHISVDLKWKNYLFVQNVKYKMYKNKFLRTHLSEKVQGFIGVKENQYRNTTIMNKLNLL